MPLLSHLFRLLSLALPVIALFSIEGVSAAVFPDVPKDHFALEAVNYLTEKSVLTGYADGTFRPDQKVNRAEALKIIASAFVPVSDTVRLKSKDFTDVPDDIWYLPSIEWAMSKKVIDGPPKKTAFLPTQAVTKAEFLKMLFAANGVDANAFGDIKLPLSSDVANTKEWSYPHLRYAVASGTTEISDGGLFGPTRELTRADVSLLLYRFTLYRSGQRTQDLLTLTHEDVENVITALSKGKATEAEYASARAILLARAAVLTEPDAVVVKVAVKIAEGYRALTRAYRAGLNGDVNTVVKLSADAATLAGQARRLSPESKSLADQLDKYSRSFSDQAKKKM
ncbi:S-layer homology domain-containing protein [Candidatus Peribacteria bacterium]|nr:S-layer homology domain-containing protein [Candidatus Peribacteria bacterium]